MVKRTFSAVIGFGLLMTANALALSIAEPYQSGQDAFERKDYKKALKIWWALADKGDRRAQSNVAWLYDKGLGVRENNDLALMWYIRSADQGYSAAQVNIGVMYEDGDGVAQSYEKALEWYRKAADQTNAIA
ncbi:MAG: sel1 repeat family protein, partial [Hyphomicrobiales bacterium]|nr:sel1 repeat family protein [Hyphomicrobiales bacterium]